MLLTRHLDANATLVALIEGLTPCDGFSPTNLPGVQVLGASCDVARGPQGNVIYLQVGSPWR